MPMRRIKAAVAESRDNLAKRTSRLSRLARATRSGGTGFLSSLHGGPLHALYFYGLPALATYAVSPSVQVLFSTLPMFVPR
jgi:hypothetical protein